MTDQTDAKRDSLRARIDAAERRNAERTLADNAREAAKAAADYTRAHPLAVVGGALAVGLVIGLLTRPGRQMARRVASSASTAVGGAASSVKGLKVRDGSRFGTMLGEAIVTYAMTLIDQAVEAGRDGQERVEEISDAASVKARKISRGAAQMAGNAAQSSRDLARNTRDTAERVVRDLARKTKG